MTYRPGLMPNDFEPELSDHLGAAISVKQARFGAKGDGVAGNELFDTATLRQTYGYYEVGNTNTYCLFSGNTSRALDHVTGNWLIGASATPTIPATPASYNIG
jgi:hypothetical protein